MSRATSPPIASQEMDRFRGVYHPRTSQGVLDVSYLGNSLAALANNEQLLERARRRFSKSPPSYRTNYSHNSTLSQSPDGPNNGPLYEEWDRRTTSLKEEHRSSWPYYQFLAQSSEEYDRISKGTFNDVVWIPIGSVYTHADEVVRKRWMEQGIWNPKWKEPYRLYIGGGWMHNEPLELESESETDSEAERSRYTFSPYHPKRRRKNAEKLQQIAERKLLRERDREASRPYYQFVHQVSKQRDWMYGQDSSIDDIDANTQAYEEVKRTWIKRGIWIKKWGILPGMWWKHERPLEELLAHDMMNLVALPRPGVESQPTAKTIQPPNYHGPALVPSPQIFGLSESRGECGLIEDVSPAQNIGKGGLTGADAEQSDAFSELADSRRCDTNLLLKRSTAQAAHRTPSYTAEQPRVVELLPGASLKRTQQGRLHDHETLPTTTSGALERPPAWSGRRSHPRKNGAQQIVGMSLGPVRPLRVSKASKKKSSQCRRQLNGPVEAQARAAAPLKQIKTREVNGTSMKTPLRRSKRIRSADPELAQALVVPDAAHAAKEIPHSTAKRTINGAQSGAKRIVNEAPKMESLKKISKVSKKTTTGTASVRGKRRRK